VGHDGGGSRPGGHPEPNAGGFAAVGGDGGEASGGKGSEMGVERMLERHRTAGKSVIDYCIAEDLPETVREVARWVASIHLEVHPELRDGRERMCFWPIPYILEEYLKHI